MQAIEQKKGEILKIMDSREKTYLERALFYKDLYKKTPWWKFKTRRNLKDNWYSALRMLERCT